MSVHYFSPAPQVGHRLREVAVTLRGRTFRLLTDRAVFAGRGVDRGTRLLVETMEVRPDDVVLDLGCGYGVIGLVAATLAPGGHAHLVDINARAADLARENAARNRVDNVTVHQGDGVEPVRGIAFDLVLTNPPIRAGRAAVLRLVAGAHAVLRPGGRLRFVARTAQGARTLARYVGALFGNVREVARGGGFRVYEAIRERSDV
ncbi:MAG: methyltransferase [Armatimonadota bacterium]|nr:methyltransferase [Armatimonadota bacterium]MDR7470887.1 methyltransferase [Armatimonadota bacterium]MDR7475822.1 methyltransferase [Armatimonadota bacterium]MDR7538802.1 methyltransferase [Armatimonadota bacterium]